MAWFSRDRSAKQEVAGLPAPFENARYCDDLLGRNDPLSCPVIWLPDRYESQRWMEMPESGEVALEPLIAVRNNLTEHLSSLPLARGAVTKVVLRSTNSEIDAANGLAGRPLVFVLDGLLCLFDLLRGPLGGDILVDLPP